MQDGAQSYVVSISGSDLKIKLYINPSLLVVVLCRKGEMLRGSIVSIGSDLPHPSVPAMTAVARAEGYGRGFRRSEI